VGDEKVYRLLGELEIGRQGRPVRLPGGATLNVLACLLVHANQRISKIALIRAAWGKDDVKEAQLHKKIQEVRELLAQAGLRDVLKTHARVGYELRVTDDDADFLSFERLVRQADELRQSRPDQDPADERQLLREALQLWRGSSPLSNVPSEAFSREIVKLVQRRKHAAARLFELELESGRHQHIIGSLSEFTSLYPSDRRLTEQFMIAAYLCGHHTEVGEAYERYRDALAEETGRPPDSLLQDLHFAVARGDEAAAIKAESEIAKRAGSPAGPLAIVARQLPRDHDLVGRGEYLTQAADLLARASASSVPVVVISGPGGIGKTALAVAAAHQSAVHFPDGQLYADLRGSTSVPADSAEVLAEFLRALGMVRVPESRPERLALYRSVLAGRRVLVLLDDAGGEEHVADLVPAQPGAAVLVTARRRLPVTGSRHMPTLEPLAHPHAAELFRRVIDAGGISTADDQGDVDRVLALCGGLPLAVRIAGAIRVRDHPRSTADLADRLARQGAHGFVHENMDVARTIEAGLELLDPRARLLFLALGLLPLPTFGHWAAAALLDDDIPPTGDPADAANVLSRLAQRFIIEPVGTGVRYRFHDLTRDYARRRAEAEYPEDRDELVARSYRALLTLARRAHARLYGGDFEIVHSSVPAWAAPLEALAEVDAAPLDWFERERDNIRLAVSGCARLGLSELCWDLVMSAHEFYTVRAYFDDWRATATTALEACRERGDHYGEAMMIVCLSQPALVASRRGDTDDAALRQAVSLLSEFEDKHGLAIAQRTLANALRRRGHLAEPLALFHDALGNYRASGDEVGCWQSLRLIGQTYLDLGRHDEARRELDGAEAAAMRLGDERLLAQTQYWIGQVNLAVGDLPAAAAAFGFVLDAYRHSASPGRAYALHGLGLLACREGDHGAADQRLGEAVTLARDGGDATLEGRSWLSIAELRGSQGQPDAQLAALREARAIFDSCGAVHMQAQALHEITLALREGGDTASADAALGRLEELYRVAEVPAGDRVHHRSVAGGWSH
jgi:DNA-binding SARP family transcriptional activator/tetratricopeptide (TPR) repeat protein